MNNGADDKIRGLPAENGKEKLLEDLEGFSQDGHGLPEEELFEQDSNEGLAKFNSDKIPVIIDRLNHGLQHHLRKNKKKKDPLPGFSFINITVITVLILIIIAWLVIRKMHS